MPDELVPGEYIRSRTHFIRGQKVMLDKDLAELYGVETRNLNKAVKRNIDRFPVDDLLSWPGYLIDQNKNHLTILPSVG